MGCWTRLIGQGAGLLLNTWEPSPLGDGDLDAPDRPGGWPPAVVGPQARGGERAVVEAGALRLRPILMTNLTTVLGMLPLAIGLGAGAEIKRTVYGTYVTAYS